MSRQSKSAYRQSSRLRSKSSRRSEGKIKDLKPRPPEMPKSKLSFNRKLFRKVNEKVTQAESKKFMINLEDLLLIEQALTILSVPVSKKVDCATACEEWWEIIGENTINNIEDLFQSEPVKLALKKCLIIGNIFLGLNHYTLCQNSQPSDLQNTLRISAQVYHQAFLHFIRFVLSRLPEDFSNSWTEELGKVLIAKVPKKHQKAPALKLLQYFNAVTVNALKKAVLQFRYTAKEGRELRTSCGHILHKIDKLSVAAAKDLLAQVFGVKKEEAPTPPTAPFLQHSATDKDFCLVLDLDETLVHYFEVNGDPQYLVRPYTQEFLSEISQFYEIVIFTAGVQSYADWVLDEIDPQRYISSRLYRQHSIQAGSFFIKDLSSIGRDLSKTIIVDNLAENFQFQPENGIVIKTWTGEPDDTALKELSAVLLHIISSKVSDVRVVLKHFREQMSKQISEGHTEDIKLVL